MDDGRVNRTSRRPILKINTLGANGSALVDSAAKSCVAGHTLYSLLEQKGHPLVSSTKIVRLADGVSREMIVLTTKVVVTLKHKTRKVSFMIFPDSVGNESLLGIDFLREFNLNFNFGSNSWRFAENCNESFELEFEHVLPLTSCICSCFRGT